MKRIKMDEQALKDLFTEKYNELVNGTSLPTSMTVQLNPTVKLADNQKVEVWFRATAYKKMQALIQQCPKEIGWHGIVSKTDDKHYEITDIVLFPQNVTGTTVTPDETEYTQWMIDFALNNEDAFNNMRFHGHSHVNMGTTPSKVDTDYQENLTKNIEDFYIFGIFNKRDEWWMNIWDMQNNVLYEKDDIKYLYEPEPEDQWAEDQIKQYVKENVYTSKASAKEKGKDKSKDKTKADNAQLVPVDNDYDYGNYPYNTSWDDEYYRYPGYNYYRETGKGKGGKSKGYGGYNYD